MHAVAELIGVGAIDGCDGWRVASFLQRASCEILLPRYEFGGSGGLKMQAGSRWAWGPAWARVRVNRERIIVSRGEGIEERLLIRMTALGRQS